MRLLLPLFLVGCGSGPTGIWLFTFADQRWTDADSCSTTTAENFIDGQWPEDSEVQTKWTYTDTEDLSGEVLFGQIDMSADDAAVLVLDGRVFPGLFYEDSWTFTWIDEALQESAADHADGYSYSETASASDLLEFTMTITHDTATGGVRAIAETSALWVETDVWDEDAVGLGTGQIPSDSYLENTASVWESVDNDPDITDCEAEDCRISATVTCNRNTDFTAGLTDLDPGDDFDGVSTAASGSVP